MIISISGASKEERRSIMQNFTMTGERLRGPNWPFYNPASQLSDGELSELAGEYDYDEAVENE